MIRIFWLYFFLPFCLGAQDSSIKFIMPYETDKLFIDQIADYQRYYTSEISIVQHDMTDILNEISDVEAMKQNRKTKRYLAEQESAIEEKAALKKDLRFHLDAWLEIEEFYDQRITEEFIEVYNPTACYRLYTLYDTLEVSSRDIMLRAKKMSKWMEYPEPIDAEYIEDVRVIQPESTKWEKRKAERDCLSSDPEDCMVWCLVKIPEEVEVISRTFNIISCPLTYDISKDGLRCEKEVSMYVDQALSKEMAVYYPALKREVEILNFEKITCR